LLFCLLSESVGGALLRKIGFFKKRFFDWSSQFTVIIKMLRKAYYIPRMLQCSVMQYRTPTAPFAEHSLDGKIAIVTGGNSGIGFETTKSLALQGCEVYILCRNPTKAQDAVSKINQSCQAAQSKGSSTALSLDLADLESVKKCIQEIRSKFQDKKIDFFFVTVESCHNRTPRPLKDMKFTLQQTIWDISLSLVVLLIC
jgi:hypothetical protein